VRSKSPRLGNDAWRGDYWVDFQPLSEMGEPIFFGCAWLEVPSDYHPLIDFMQFPISNFVSGCYFLKIALISRLL